MPRFECSKCGSLVVVGQGVETATCNVCGKKQSVPAEAVDDGPVATRSNYDPQWDHYEKLLHKARRYSDIRILKETAEEFDRLGDYENSWEMAQFCRKRIAEEEIKQQEKDRLQQIANERKAKGEINSHIKMWLMNIGVVLIFVIPTLIFNMLINPNRDYKEAESLMAKGRYEEAIDIFAELDGFKDSEDRIVECETNILESRYNNAVDAMNSGRFLSAQASFNQCGDYKDSAALAVECKYQNACLILGKRDYERAFQEFQELGDYKDSEELWQASLNAYQEETYNQAVEYMNAGSYDTALRTFKKINGYMDSDIMIQECGYRIAVGYMEIEKYQWALNELEKILDYKDAADLAEQARAKLALSE